MLNILILCTGNSARSILAEALFNFEGEGRVRAWSAGSKPAGAVNRHALSLLAAKGFDTSSFRSKSWDEFEGPDAPVMDAVITVCDSAASEACPVWPGAPVRAHWGLPDPAGVEPDDDARAAFEATFAALQRRVRAVLAEGRLDDPARLQAALNNAHAEG
ncbi:MAG: arsenate reductase ArsC [Alphaproteobacteria bacterium]|nr:arsenate reductase ArsC [Alphaproteobacteria bacterium]